MQKAFVGDICNPAKGAVFLVRFCHMTTPGIHAELVDESGAKPVTVFLFQNMHATCRNFARFADPEFAEKNPFMKVRILDTRFELDDVSISAIGQMMSL